MLRIQQTVGSDKPQIHEDNGVNSARQELDSIKSDIKEQGAHLDILANDITTKQGSIVLLSKEITELESKILSLKQDIGELQEQKSYLVDQINRYDNDVKRLSKVAYDTKEKFISDNAKNQSIVDEIVSKIAKKTAEITSLEEMFTNLSASRGERLKNLDDQIILSENRVKTLSDIINGKNDAICDLNLTTDALATKKRTLEDEIKVITNEQSERFGELGLIKGEKAELESKITDLFSELQSLQANVASHKVISDNLDKREAAVKAMEIELQVKFQKFLKQHVNNNE